MRVVLPMLILLAVASQLAYAGATPGDAALYTPAERDLRYSPPGDSTAFWSQTFEISTCQAYSASYRTNDGYWMLIADDFYSATGDSIVTAEWWGFDDSGGEVAEFIIRVHEDDPSGRFDAPGDVLYDHSVFSFAAEYVAPVNKYHYTCDLPVAFTPTAGVTYWLSISAVHASKQWYWFECVEDDYWGAEATMKSDYWSQPNWVPLSVYYGGMNYTEMAFILYSRDGTPVERRSWGRIKATYR